MLHDVLSAEVATRSSLHDTPYPASAMMLMITIGTYRTRLEFAEEGHLVGLGHIRRRANECVGGCLRPFCLRRPLHSLSVQLHASGLVLLSRVDLQASAGAQAQALALVHLCRTIGINLPDPHGLSSSLLEGEGEEEEECAGGVVFCCWSEVFKAAGSGL